MQGELGQQLREFAFVANHVHAIRQAQRRFQQVIGHRLGHRIGDAHAKLQRLCLVARQADGFFQLVTQRKNLLGVAQCNPPFAGQLQPSAALSKKVVTEPLLQLLDLP